ncbi:MAG: DNA polymerase IV [Leptospirales bacterium]|nr:DNA polymerase IV [Leptospirales bacterium]
MDAFYPSVEQRDNPSLRGRPVIVGGRPDSRGVVSSCSYEARKYGVRSAMSSSLAFRLCPNAVFLPGRFDAYKAVSRQVHEIFYEYSDLIEPLSLDEAYIDVTANKKGISSATIIAQEIRKRIKKETGLTASAGVSYNKFIAKAASDFNKPDGIKVVKPDEAADFLDALPIGRFYGIGKATEKRFLAMGVTNGRELKRLDCNTLVRFFGKPGRFYYDIVRGVDTRAVEPYRERQSVGKERTMAFDLDNTDEMLLILASIAEEVSAILKRSGLSGKTVTLKVKYPDFISVTRSYSSPEALSESSAIMKYIPGLLARTEAFKKSVRLLGISVSGFERRLDVQLPLPFKK